MPHTAYAKTEADAATVKELVLRHLPLVRSIVNRILPGLVAGVSEDDLIGAGMLGLVEAAHRYDGRKGVQFQTFAYPRIKGAIIDFLRQGDHLAKSARNHLRLIRRTLAEFRMRRGRRPSIAELADAAGMTETEVLRYLSYEKWDRVGSLETRFQDADGQQVALKSLISSDAETPLGRLEHRELLERLAQAITELPEREQQVIVMYYYEDLYMAEMAEVLGISESRVSQLHTRALYNLARKLEEGAA